MGVLAAYGNAPGRAEAAPERWPSPAGLALEPDGATLVAFAHPRCPCTRASLRELERLAAESANRLRGTVLFYRPASAPAGWERTDLWELAERIPGVRAATDVDGALARSFGAETSGHVVVYDAAGDLAFQGGVTAARGHEGGNRGRDAIRHLLRNGRALEAETPVFGCPLVAAPIEGARGDDAAAPPKTCAGELCIEEEDA
jgi:hypothetical protein